MLIREDACEKAVLIRRPRSNPSVIPSRVAAGRMVLRHVGDPGAAESSRRCRRTTKTQETVLRCAGCYAASGEGFYRMGGQASGARGLDGSWEKGGDLLCAAPGETDASAAVSVVVDDQASDR